MTTPEQKTRQQVVELVKYTRENKQFFKITKEQEKRIKQLIKEYNIKENEL